MIGLAHIQSLSDHAAITMRAWEAGKDVEEMAAIFWDNDLEKWYKWNLEIDSFFVENGKKLEWKNINGTFTFSPQM